MLTLQKGTRINNYLLEERLGAGAFGEVWRARHHVLDETVAIKVPTQPDYVRHLQREGVVVHALRHPNIVRAIDLDPYADPPYLVMEYVPGVSLRRAIEHYRASFPVSAAVTVLRGVLRALAAAHGRGVVHRDLKPENVLLAHALDGPASINEGAVKVTDFGLGRVGGAATESMLQSGSFFAEDGRGISGTLAYMSPEQRENQPVDARSDLYSCGILLFEMLTGERPQGTETPSLLRPGLPKTLDDVFRRAYTRLDRRYASAEQMLEALSAVRAEAIDVAGPAGRCEIGGAGGEKACPRCARAVRAGDQYCIHCGVQLAAVVPRCGECGGFVLAADRYCIFCGNKLRLVV